MENRERAAIEERKWRLRVATTILVGLVLGLGIFAIGFLATGATVSNVLIGLLLLTLLTYGVAYYFGAGMRRIASLPSPDAGSAGPIAKRLAWVFPLLGVMGLVVAYPLLAGWYTSSPSPRREIVSVGATAGLCVMVLLGIVLQRWRTAIIKMGKSAEDRMR